MADIDDAFDQLYSSPGRFMQTYYFKLTGAYDSPDSPDPKTSGLSIFRFSEIEYCAMTLHGPISALLQYSVNPILTGKSKSLSKDARVCARHTHTTINADSAI